MACKHWDVYYTEYKYTQFSFFSESSLKIVTLENIILRFYLTGLCAVDYLWCFICLMEIYFVKNMCVLAFAVGNLMVNVDQEHNLQTQTQYKQTMYV